MKATALVAWNVRKLRVRYGLSQEALAVDAGVDRSYVGRIERGIENPTAETLERFDLPPLKWSSLKYGFAVEDRIDGKEEAYS